MLGFTGFSEQENELQVLETWDFIFDTTSEAWADGAATSDKQWTTETTGGNTWSII